MVEHSPAVSGVGPAESAQAVTVYPEDGLSSARTLCSGQAVFVTRQAGPVYALTPVRVLFYAGGETCRAEDSLLQQSGDDRAVSCNCALCSTPRRRMAWACCCCSVFIIILSFFLALYLPITAFLNGTKLRLVHVSWLAVFWHLQAIAHSCMRKWAGQCHRSVQQSHGLAVSCTGHQSGAGMLALRPP